MDELWRIELLGGLRVIQGERVITRFRTRKTAALLAYLAFYLHRSHAREELIELLWPEAEPALGRRSLRTALASLRHQLEPPGVPPGAVLLADRSTVRLNPEAVSTDVALCEAALRDPERRAEAAELYQGELLPGFLEEWVFPERRRLAETHLQGLHALMAERERAGELAEAVRWALRAVAADPLREESQQTLIRLLVRSGQREAAVRQYEELARLLERELGAAPCPEVRAFIRELEKGGARAQPEEDPSRETARKRVAIPGRNGDGAPGEQAVAAEPTTALPPFPDGSVPPAPAAAAAPTEPFGYLPRQFTRFFGRGHEVIELRELLLSEEVPLVTLMGPGGTGKTRLALQVAQQLRDRFDGSVWFVPLLDLNEPRLIVDKLLEVLRLPRASELEPLKQGMTYLSSRRTLLVLDNFEHLVEGGAEVVHQLLQGTERLTVLATSRQRLGLEGEREYSVGPLPAPAFRDDPAELLSNESVQLFVDRAQGVRPDFQITRHNAAAVAGLCARLEGLPLAIELAAARSGVLTPQQILARLEQRFELLTTRQRAADPRHSSLRAALDWSYHLLTPELQRFFERLAVFQGGWSLEAAEAVCQDPMAMDHLQRLRECSLVVAEEPACPRHLQAVRSPEQQLVGGDACLLPHEAGTGMRYRFLETVREYAWERLEAGGSADAVRERHLAYFSGLAEAAEPDLEGPTPAAWLQRLEIDLDNLRAALTWAEASGRLETGLRLAVALWRFWHRSGYRVEGQSWLAKALEAGDSVAARLRAQALRRGSELALMASDLAAVRAMAEASLVLYRQVGDKAGLAGVLPLLGELAVREQDSVAARACFEESLALWRELDDAEGVAVSLWHLAWLAFVEGDRGTAQSLLEERLSTGRALGSRWVALASFRNRVSWARACADPALTRSLYAEGLALRRQWGSTEEVADLLRDLAGLARDLGDYAVAQRLLEENLAALRALGNRLDASQCLRGMSRAMRLQGHLTAARAAIEEGLRLAREVGGLNSICHSLDELRLVAVRQGDWEVARSVAPESLAVWQQLGNPWGLAESLEGVAHLAVAQGQCERAARLFGAAKQLRETINRPLQGYEREDWARSVAEIRAALGEEAFAAAWEAGRALTPEQAMAAALEEG